MPEIGLDWDGLINLLATHLYGEKYIFIRELIQNGHDAILRRRHLQPGFEGRIDIRCDPSRSTIEFTDDGIGMDERSLVDYLSTIGKGETRAVKEQIEGLIGGFGLGFLSAFVVADRVEVLTRKLGDSSGWLWVNTGSRRYEIAPSHAATTGTKVTIFVKASAAGLLEEREVEDVVRQLADMLRTPIYLNDRDVPINRGGMPWESGADDESLALDCLAYLKTHALTPVLEAFPLTLGEDGIRKAQGVLYIASTRVIALDAPRAVEVYVDRMLVRRNAPEILPQWASFVDGAINFSSLQPTTARDSIVLDSSFEQMKDEIGHVIIDQLDSIRRGDSSRFSRILESHALRIRAACLACDSFRDKFADAVEWQVNSGDSVERRVAPAPKRLTLPAILNLLRCSPAGEPRRLLCFSEGNADHFFEMADAAGTLVIDASGPLEMQLLEVMAQRSAGSLLLVRVDREDADELFTLAGGESHPVVRLARTMSCLVHPFHGRLDVSARRFEPASLPAILRRGEDAREREQAPQILRDPARSSDSRELADFLLKQPPKPMKVTINAANGFVTRLAAMGRFDDDDVQRLMMGLCSSAILASGAVSERNASFLHADYVRLMAGSLDSLERERGTSRSAALR